MPVRLPVVVSQSARRDGRTVDLEESLITQLMLTQGLDATIVASLESIQLDSTDHLCLQDVGQEIILSGWLPLESAATDWLRLQLAGQLLPFGFNSEIGSTTGSASIRRIRYLQLTHQTRIDEIINQLQQILASRQVQTVSIQLSSKPPQNPPDNSPQNPQQPSTRHQGHDSKGSTLIGSSELVSLDKSTSLPSTDVDSKANNWDNLDKLVDDLDALDL